MKYVRDKPRFPYTAQQVQRNTTQHNTSGRGTRGRERKEKKEKETRFLQNRDAFSINNQFALLHQESGLRGA